VKLPRFFQVAHQRPQRIEEQSGEPLLLGRDPILVQSGQQRPLVQLHGGSEKLRPFQAAARTSRDL
jgi:hypothetical protein